MDKYIDAFFKRFGEPTIKVPAPPEMMSAYRGVLPGTLLELWDRFGPSGFCDGLFWITNPADYAGAIQEWFADTNLLEGDDYHVIARSGFGRLYVWGIRNGFQYEVIPYHARVMIKDGYREEIATTGASLALKGFFATRLKDSCDVLDTDRKPLFARAVAEHGALAPDEAFGFAPALFIGGAPKLERIKKVDIHVHLSLLAQFGQREILDKDALARKALGPGARWPL